jgi:opacity protein-like surface antigen
MTKPTIRSLLPAILAVALLSAVPAADAVRMAEPRAAAPATAATDPLQAISGESAAAPTANNPSGVAMPEGNVTNWKQIFSDNFPTSVKRGRFSGCSVGSDLMRSDCKGLPAAVAAKWFAFPDGWKDTAGNGEYEPSQVLSIDHHELDFYIHSNAAGRPLVAAPEPKIPGGIADDGLLYGAYMVRFKANMLPGYKTAWLLWPDAYDYGAARWPADGEIDFPEADLNGTIGAFMHWQGASSGQQQDVFGTSQNYSVWHTAVIEWTPQTVRFILDGRIVGSATGHIPSTPMHWVLQTETATDGKDPAKRTAGHVLVAWVAVYQPRSLL